MRAFALLLMFAMLAIRGGAEATMSEPIDAAGATLTNVPSGAEVRRSAPTSLPALNPWRYVVGNSVHPERAALDNQPQIPAGAQGGRTPGIWALLVAGLVGALAIGRRRLSSIADPSIARRRRGRE